MLGVHSQGDLITPPVKARMWRAVQVRTRKKSGRPVREWLVEGSRWTVAGRERFRVG